jgi:hypothetical protein
MSAEAWLDAAKAEEERLLDVITKTTLYKQLEVVRRVISVYEATAEPPGTSEQQAPAVPPTPTNGQASRPVKPGFQRTRCASHTTRLSRRSLRQSRHRRDAPLCSAPSRDFRCAP